MYYRICEYCGAALDPGEICDCVIDIAEKAKEKTGGKQEQHYITRSSIEQPFREVALTLTL